MAEQTSELDVVETSQELLEWRVPAERRAAPGRHTDVHLKTRQVSLDRIAQEHRPPSIGGCGGEQPRYPGSADINRRPLTCLVAGASRKILVVAGHLGWSAATGVEAVEIVKLLLTR